MSIPTTPLLPPSSQREAEALARQWARDPRWSDVERTYTAADVIRLRGRATQDADPRPGVVRRIHDALLRADRIALAESGKGETDWPAPLVADAEAGFGRHLDVFGLTRRMITDGAAEVHLEDRAAVAETDGPVLVPTAQHVRSLNAARLAADVAGVPAVVIGRTDALGATLLTTDADDRDREFLTGERTTEGFHRVRPGIDQAISRGLAYAPYVDLLRMTGTLDPDEARRFAGAIHARFPGTRLAYDCSPGLDHSSIRSLARGGAELGAGDVDLLDAELVGQLS
jgi:isocitrate lyase